MNGILSVEDYITVILQNVFHGEKSFNEFWKFPSLALFARRFDVSVDALCVAIMLLGLLCSLLICLGFFINSVLFIICWLCYLSLFLVGQTFLSFQWDILLLEVGFLAIFISGIWSVRPLPSIQINWCFRFLAWKLMFLSGIVKLQARCPTWEKLTALEYHFATQCIPTPLSWWAHQLPPILLRASVAATLIIEIPLTFLLILPFRESRRIGVIFQVILQILIILTGNYNFFNLLTIALMLPAWADDYIDSPLTADTNLFEEVVCNTDTMTCSREPIQEKFSLSWSNIDTEGPFVALAAAVRLVDYSIIGRASQWIATAIFVCLSSTYMIRYTVDERAAGWEAVRLSLAVTYDDVEAWLLPSSMFAVGTTY